MSTRRSLILWGALALAAPLCLSTAAKDTPVSMSQSSNPLLSVSPLPFQYPVFDQVRVEHYLPAFEQAMQEEMNEVLAIANNPESPTFENTLVALERSGQAMDRIARIFGGLNGTVTTPEMQAIEKELAPKLAAHGDAIRLNPSLFQRIEAVYQNREALNLDPESLRLVERSYRGFVRSGATLPEEKKAVLRTLNAELASLRTTFSQNILKEVNASALLVKSKEELEGLPEAAITAAEKAARKAGHEKGWLLRLTNTTGQPPLAQLKNRALRERLFKASIVRGTRGGEFDNRKLICEIVRKRAEKAALLGYASHAAYFLEDQTAGTVDAVNDLLKKLSSRAVENARREGAAIEAMLQKDLPGAKLEPWDWAYYAEKVRAERYAFDEAALKPYYEAHRVLEDGVFYAASKFYGVSFKARTDLPKYHPDTSTYEICDADGTTLAFLIVDWYARPEKKGGAWANSYVSQSELLGTHPVIGNHLNLPKPPEGEPTLMTHDEVNTAFHEFGHNLHALFSKVKYPRFAGTAVPRDFVEFPSQVNEMWATWPEVLTHYAKHYKTGELMPADLIAKVEAAAKFNQGFATTEYLAAAVLDQAWHQLLAEEVPSPDQVEAFEKHALEKAGFTYAAVPPRYRSAYFAHVFPGGYSAGYYSYIWSEVLDADTVAWIRKQGGLLRDNGDRLRAMILSRGGSADPMELYRAFRGGDPDLKPLLERRGLSGSE